MEKWLDSVNKLNSKVLRLQEAAEKLHMDKSIWLDIARRKSMLQVIETLGNAHRHIVEAHEGGNDGK